MQVRNAERDENNYSGRDKRSGRIWVSVLAAGAFITSVGTLLEVPVFVCDSNPITIWLG